MTIVDRAARKRNCVESARLEERSVRLCYLSSRLQIKKKRNSRHLYFMMSCLTAFSITYVICGQFKVLFPWYIGLNEALHNCYSSPNITTPIKSGGGGRIKLAEHVAHTRDERKCRLKFGLKN